jgi:hypothetical protein
MSKIKGVIDQIYALRDEHEGASRAKDARIRQLENDNAYLAYVNTDLIRLFKAIEGVVEKDPDCACSAWAVGRIEKDHACAHSARAVGRIAELLSADVSNVRDEITYFRKAIEDIQRIVDDEYVQDAGLALDAIEKRIERWR